MAEARHSCEVLRGLAVWSPLRLRVNEHFLDGGWKMAPGLLSAFINKGFLEPSSLLAAGCFWRLCGCHGRAEWLCQRS